MSITRFSLSIVLSTAAVLVIRATGSSTAAQTARVAPLKTAPQRAAPDAAALKVSVPPKHVCHSLRSPAGIGLTQQFPILVNISLEIGACASVIKKRYAVIVGRIYEKDQTSRPSLAEISPGQATSPAKVETPAARL